MTTDAVARLQEAGFTQGEARAYVTLLEAEEVQGLTGYEVSSRSGVPRSAIYSVLGRLETLGAASRVGQQPARFTPIDPARFVEHAAAESNARLARVGESLSRMPKRQWPEPVWTMSRYDDVIQAADQLIRAAHLQVCVSLWARELDVLRPALAAATVASGLHRVLHGPDLGAGLGADPVAGWSSWSEGLGTDTDKASWSHKLIVVVDQAEALIGGAEPDGDNHAVLTRNPSLVDLATNHVILDITRVAQTTGRSCAGAVAPLMRPHGLTTG